MWTWTVPETAQNQNDKKDIEKEINHCDRIKLKIYQNIQQNFSDYCENCSLHGIKYIGEKRRTAIERIWWIIIFLISIYICADQVKESWIKWKTSPIGFVKSRSSIRYIPFPALTICPQIKCKQTIFNYTEAAIMFDKGANITSEMLKKLQDMSLICDYQEYSDGDLITDESTIDFLQKVAPELNTTLMHCEDMPLLCTDIFTPILTEEGQCFSFNILNSTDIYHDKIANKYILNTNINSYNISEKYPIRAIKAGPKSSYTIYIETNEQDIDYICKGPIQGYKIFLHNPSEVPTLSQPFQDQEVVLSTQQYIHAQLNQEVNIAVTPKKVVTKPSFKNYHPLKRHCYFPNETKLTYYKIYTQQNCELECLTKYTLEKCGCVSYYMPRFANTPICGPGNNFCVSQAQTELQDLAPEFENFDEKELAENFYNCNCLPACNSVHYTAETTNVKIQWKKVFQAYNEGNSSLFKGMHLSIVNIYFKHPLFTVSHRKEFYGATDFLASCGGLLGLFMGFSFLSLMEIVYFLILRFWCNIKMQEKKTSKNNIKTK